MQDKIEAIIPVELDGANVNVKNTAKDILEQNDRYGFTYFMLVAPCAGHRSLGFPTIETFRCLARKFVEVRNLINNENIHLGFWLCVTLKSGSNENFTKVVRFDGSESPFANCPYDDNFANSLAKSVAEFSAIANPEFIMTEDDYSMAATSYPFGCLCDKHISKFNEINGSNLNRKEIVELLKGDDEKSVKAIKNWQYVQKDSLINLAKKIREELDKVNPKIAIGYMQPGSADMDGDTTEDLSSILAGEGNTPFSRIFGTFYCGFKSKELPQTMFNALYTKEHLRTNLKCYHESDTFPHTVFYSSASQMKAIMSVAYSYGLCGSTFQTQQLLDYANEEKAFGTMFKKERERFSEVKNTVKEAKIEGVEITYDRFINNIYKEKLDGNKETPLWANSLWRFGIPYTSKKSNVAVWDYRQAKYYDDKTIKEYLSKGLILDGESAKILSNRGYSEFLGVEVLDNPIKGELQYDLYCRERIEKGFYKEGEGREMPTPHIYCPSGNGILLELKVIDKNVEVISRAYSFESKPICVSMTRFTNKLGGKIVVMGMTLKGNNSQALINYRRGKLLREMVSWCGGDYPMIDNLADVMIINNKLDNGNLLTITNLCEDSYESIPITVNSELKNAKRIEKLDENGKWKKIKFIKEDNKINVKEKLDYLESKFLLFK